MLTETRYEHIILDDQGRPLIAGTTMKVIELVVEHLAYGWSPDELSYQHPYLTLGQIYSALAYYADHQEEIDREIEENTAEYERLRAAAENSPLRQKLRAKGLIK
jgi:uncharacterized protein (DUF433 family)